MKITSKPPELGGVSIQKQKADEAEVTEIVDLDDDDCDFCYTTLSNKGTAKRTPISVEQYSEDRDLNLAIMASLKSSSKPNKQKKIIDLSLDSDYYYIDDDIRVFNFQPQDTPFGKRRKTLRDSMTEKGQSSNSKTDPDFVCDICVESKILTESFSIEGCTHAYCTDCIAQYVASKLQENITNIRCPVSDCKGLLEAEYCRSILPAEVFDRWGNALCESLILGSEKFYCPFKDCSAMLIDDGGQVIRESECPNCWRMFCAQCKVPWHWGIECEEFQKLNKDEREMEDIMLMKLAEDKRWRRCPNCRIYVERIQGCRYMRCRCGTSFCYGCGTTSISTASHFCSYCRG